MLKKAALICLYAMLAALGAMTLRLNAQSSSQLHSDAVQTASGEMKALQNIDIAFLCMNLPYTMTPGEAADCAKAFRPKIVYPYHFRGSNPQEFADALTGTPGVEVRIRKWY